MRALILISVVCFSWNIAQAQFSNKRCQWITPSDGSLVLDSLSVEPGSIVTSPAVAFEFDLGSNMLNVTPSSGNLPDSVEVCYRVFPFNLSQSHTKHSLNEYDSTVATAAVVVPNSFVQPQREEIFSVDGIQKSGSISRGVSFGSNQDVFVNSALNLQMEGKITDDLNIRAVITDQNIPFQPEGNTQQVQDFDNVFIQLYNDKFSLTGGDVVLRNKSSQFLRYYKNVQGGQGTLKYKAGEKLNAESSAAFSIAKGKFASIQVQPLEGVAGPYKLRGPEGQRFIIVLANSEKVYVDGKLMERGFNNDYVIDYNLGEVTFTNRIVITQFTRIRIDFEYSDRNYSRSIMQTSHYFNTEKTDFHFNFYQEKDDRNKPLSYDLTDEEKVALSRIGDDVSRAAISGADSVAFNENLILYAKADTLDADGNAQEIFRYSVNPEEAHFSVTFAEVGPGNGDYVLLNTTTNGRVHQWVSPVNGIAQGSFAPITPITTPSMKQMMTMGVGVNISPTDRVYSEMALSNQDINLYSKIGNDDNQGYALKVGYIKEATPLAVLPGFKISGEADFEHDHKNFRAIDRFRSIEFNRDWGIPNNLSDSVTDNILNGAIRVSKDRFNEVSYRFSARRRGNQVNGEQHSLKTANSLGRMQFDTDLFLLGNDQEIQTNQWRRWTAETYYRSKIFEPGYRYSVDRNEVVSTVSDQVLSTAMNFDEHLMFLRSNDSLQTRFNVSYALREDRLPVNGRLVDNNRSQTGNISLGTTIKDNHDLDLVFIYRNLENLNATEEEEQHEETISGRLDWVGSFLDDHLRSEMTYATNNSRELRREYVFLQVNTGEGTHTWRDLNNDGVQDLSEFFEAINPDERNYVKIFVPTDEFIQAYSNLFNYRLSANMPRAWKGAGGIKSLLARFSNVTAVNMDKKITDDDLGARFLPFRGGVRDEDILAIRQSIRSTFFFNRANPGYAMDFSVLSTDSKQLLTNGIESRYDDQYSLNLRYSLNRHYNFTINLLRGEQSSFSDFLEGQNYLINTNRAGPEFVWQPTSRFRLSTGYIHTHKQNIFSENQGEKVSSNEMRFDMRITKANASTMNATFRLISNEFEGDENSALGYQLLDGLRPGRNATWNFNFQRKLANGLRVTLNYDGRKSEEQRVIHMGRMQVTALF